MPELFFPQKVGFSSWKMLFLLLQTQGDPFLHLLHMKRCFSFFAVLAVSSITSETPTISRQIWWWHQENSPGSAQSSGKWEFPQWHLMTTMWYGQKLQKSDWSFSGNCLARQFQNVLRLDITVECSYGLLARPHTKKLNNELLFHLHNHLVCFH